MHTQRSSYLLLGTCSSACGTECRARLVASIRCRRIASKIHPTLSLSRTLSVHRRHEGYVRQERFPFTLSICSPFHRTLQLPFPFFSQARVPSAFLCPPPSRPQRPGGRAAVVPGAQSWIYGYCRLVVSLFGSWSRYGSDVKRNGES